jgi:polysaccharide pyruvyl transferase WcaK-like protein
VVLFGGDRADEPVAAEVERAVAALQGGDRATGVDRVTPRTFDDLLAVVRSCDVVAGSRYHNVVGALISGLPAVAVVDRVKLRDLAWSVGLGELVHEARSLDGAALASTIELALDQRAALAARVRAAGAPLADAARNELVALDAIVRAVVGGPAISR